MFVTAESKEFLKHLLCSGYLQQECFRILVSQIIDCGEDTLTPQQRSVVFWQVERRFVTLKCACCGYQPDWIDMLEAYEHDGLCTTCYFQIKRAESLADQAEPVEDSSSKPISESAKVTRLHRWFADDRDMRGRN